MLPIGQGLVLVIQAVLGYFSLSSVLSNDIVFGFACMMALLLVEFVYTRLEKAVVCT